ncbi:MAG: hypothetical protein ACK5MU_01120 [Candidatus Saccharimonadales bacterium]
MGSSDNSVEVMIERYSGNAETGGESEIGGALERLKEKYNFDIDTVLKAGERDFSAGEMQDRAQDIAGELNFDDEFFADDARMMTLLMVAESSVAADGLPEEKQAQEREMLMDVLLAAGAEHSATAREMAKTDEVFRDRYFDSGEVAEIEQAQYEFLDARVDEELSAGVYEAMKGEYLADVREKLGVTTETEQPFDVKVVKFVEYPFMLKNMGVFGEEMEFPALTADGEDPEVAEQRKKAREWNGRVQEALTPYTDAKKEYAEKFEPELGKFVAFLRSDTNTIYMSAVHAYAILGEETMDGFGERGTVKSESDMAKEAAVIRHEYVHSQKIMVRGAHSQLGLSVEERRAELLSGDKQGYQDEKNFFLDMTFATNYNMMRRLEEASQTDNPYASFVTKVSESIGMRSALLMMAATPPAYEKNKEMSPNFVSLDYLKQDGDESAYDAIVGSELERFGDDGMKELVENYVETGGKERLESIYGMRKLTGMGRHRAEYMKARIDELTSAGNEN